jgi:transcriptional regulator with XRE-family HTH domain
VKKNNKLGENNVDSGKKSFWDRLNNACRGRGLSVAKVVEAIGLAPGTPTGWKKSAPVGETVLALARYLGVTTDSLLSDEPLISNTQVTQSNESDKIDRLLSIIESQQETIKGLQEDLSTLREELSKPLAFRASSPVNTDKVYSH